MKLEELCRDFSNKNKAFESNIKSTPIEEATKRADYIRRYSESIGEMERGISDEALSKVMSINSQLKCKVGMILEDNLSQEREFQDFCEYHKGIREQKH